MPHLPRQRDLITSTPPSTDPLLADNPDRKLTLTRTSSTWDHILDRLGDYADQAEKRPWLNDCHDCDKVNPCTSLRPQQTAEYGGHVRAWRDQIVDQLADQTATTATLVRRTKMPLKTNLHNLAAAIAIQTVLTQTDICTLGNLAAYSDADLLESRRFGAARYAEWRAALRTAAEARCSQGRSTPRRRPASLRRPAPRRSWTMVFLLTSATRGCAAAPVKLRSHPSHPAAGKRAESPQERGSPFRKLGRMRLHMRERVHRTESRYGRHPSPVKPS
ncbi:hypothetical protein GCM10009733_021270 [Nonomuraea maheshkhaliensis]|uniref:Uncharacterized protein n=1 Tax=Nonomuraea maheshkhaliensis TaxID=419590 RepID=A0ABP4QVJ1_9ACTN